MKIRFASALLALSLPLFAQDPAAQAETMFYKAFYLEKGPRDFAAAMTLYEQFLAAAPDHKLASEAAKQQFGLLDRTGKTKERDAFKEKYSKLLGNVVATGAGDAPPAAGDRPARGGAGAGGDRPAQGGGRPDQAARLAELEKQLATAKAEGNEEKVKELTAQIERAKAGGGRGQGGPGGGRMGGGLFGTKKLTEMTPEELTTFKGSLANIDTMVERMRERMTPEQVKGVETHLPALKKSLEENKLEDAQKSLDALRESMPRGRGRGGDAGAGGQPPAGNGGGRGGNNGGGGGTNGNGGGGGR